VQHGRIWSTCTPPAFAPTLVTPPPTPAQPSTPKSDRSSPLIQQGSEIVLPRQSLPSSICGQGVPEQHPYISHGFKIQDSVIYISDVSWISEESWAVLKQPSVSDPLHQYDVAIVDCLRPLHHISHFGIKEAVNAARRINAKRTYLTGFAHEVSHDEYVTLGEYVGGKVVENPTDKERHCMDFVDEGNDIWLRPSHDGLRIEISCEGTVTDNSYE
jgi:hypothetical protein